MSEQLTLAEVINGDNWHLDALAPVVVWVTLDFKPAVWGKYPDGVFVDNGHVVTVDGYNSSSFHIVDPEYGTYWVSKSSFYESYKHMKFAVAFL